MERDRGSANRERAGNLDHGLCAAAEDLEDPASVAVTQRFEHRVPLLRRP